MGEHYYAHQSPFYMKDKGGGRYRLRIENDPNPMSPREFDNMTTMVCCNRRYDLGDFKCCNMEDFFRDIVLEYAKPHDVVDYITNGQSSLVKVESGEDGVPMVYSRFANGDNWCVISALNDINFGDICGELPYDDLVKIVLSIENIVIVPLYLYDHSGISISTMPFNDSWDSACVGYVYTDKGTIMEIDSVSDETWKKKAIEVIENEVSVYDMFLKNEVYGYVLEKERLVEERCPHCGQTISSSKEWVEQESCWGFYGDDLGDNGILSYISNELVLAK